MNGNSARAVATSVAAIGTYCEVGAVYTTRKYEHAAAR